MTDTIIVDHGAPVDNSTLDIEDVEFIDIELENKPDFQVGEILLLEEV